MIKSVWIWPFIALLLTSCVSMTDFENSQSQLRENSKKQKVFSDAKQAAQSTEAVCMKPNPEGKWEIDISHGDRIVKQGTENLGYFKTLCFTKLPEQTRLEIVGVHAGGGMGKAFFLLPKISIFDENWNLVTSSLSQIKQNAFSGNLDAIVDLSKVKPGKYVMVLEGDNRSGKRGIGEYTQATYAVVPIITSINMYSLPTGKARIQLSTKR